jgi:hypothetical protein
MSMDSTNSTNSPEVQSSATAITDSGNHNHNENGRRRHPRYTVQVPIEIRPEGSAIPMRLETTDLSRGGCYLRLLTPLHVGIRVQATLWLSDYPIVVRGRVVTRHPHFGNGIMFVDFEGHAEVLLKRYLDAIIG